MHFIDNNSTIIATEGIETRHVHHRLHSSGSTIACCTDEQAKSIGKYDPCISKTPKIFQSKLGEWLCHRPLQLFQFCGNWSNVVSSPF